VKAGNSVEDKTLRIRKGSLDFSISSLRDGKPWTGGDADSTEEPI
jgi:hypothetical protein